MGSASPWSAPIALRWCQDAAWEYGIGTAPPRVHSFFTLLPWVSAHPLPNLWELHIGKKASAPPPPPPTTGVSNKIRWAAVHPNLPRAEWTTHRCMADMKMEIGVNFFPCIPIWVHFDGGFKYASKTVEDVFDPPPRRWHHGSMGRQGGPNWVPDQVSVAINAATDTFLLIFAVSPR